MREYNKLVKTILLSSMISLVPLSGNCEPFNGKKKDLQQSINQTKKIDKEKTLKPNDIILTKNLEYKNHILNDTYPYKDTTRSFQWNIIKDKLAQVEQYNDQSTHWLIFTNYKNLKGVAPLVRKYEHNKYNHIADTLGTERYQSVPLYGLNDTISPTIYGEDGSLARYFNKEGSFIKVSPLYKGGKWLVPMKYVKLLPDSIIFKKVIVVDRANQNIVTLERVSRGNWEILSMSPATTGRDAPPYQYATPLGIFVIQEKKEKMIYNKDGSNEPGGFAPYANRFTNGGYIHGVPSNYPNTKIIDYSPTLGTVPRSHMCVRTPSSLAKFIYNWETIDQTLVIVID